jgi:hypothetical protein
MHRKASLSVLVDLLLRDHLLLLEHLQILPPQSLEVGVVVLQNGSKELADVKQPFSDDCVFSGFLGVLVLVEVDEVDCELAGVFRVVGDEEGGADEADAGEAVEAGDEPVQAMEDVGQQLAVDGFAVEEEERQVALSVLHRDLLPVVLAHKTLRVPLPLLQTHH